MPKIGRRRLAREVVRILGERQDSKAIIRQLAAYLIDTKQTKQLDMLVKDIADEMFMQRQHMTAEVSFAHDMTVASIRTALTDLLTQATGAQTVEFNTSVNPDIVGGVLVRTPRYELDATVRRQLKQIAGGIK